jgi:hypothetical protein
VLGVMRPMPEPSKYWMHLQALVLLGLVVLGENSRAARARAIT